MTVSTTTSRADYTGNGVTTAFAVPFYFLDSSHLTVLRTVIATGVSTTLALTTDYTVSGAGVAGGGTVTLVTAPTSLQKISILRNVPFTQLIHYVPNDPFPAATHEQALDQLTMEVQQVSELVSRALTLPPATTGVSTNLPTAQPNQLLAFNSAGTAITSVNPVDVLTVAGSSGFSTQAFSGTGAQTAFSLTASPGAIANLEVFISGVRQRPTTDYTVSGQTLTFVSAPASGTNNILCRWGTTLGIGIPSDGSVTAAKMAAGAAVSNIGPGGVTPTLLANAGAELGMRNRIINGAMAIWQRGTSFSFAGYSADRWFSYVAGGLPSTSQSSDVPAGAGFAYSAFLTGTGAGVRQAIESVNTVDLVGNSVTVSFWMKQTVGAGTGSMVVWLDYANAKDNFGSLTTIGPVAITPTASWAKYTVTFNNLPAGAANGLMLFFEPANWVVTDTFLVTGVQLEKGATATPFEFRPYSVELAMCQRYYQKSRQSYTPATGFSGGNGSVFLRYAAGNDAYVQKDVPLYGPMRAAPTVTTYDSTGASGKFSYYVSSWVNSGASNISSTSDSNFLWQANNLSAVNYNFEWAASAEL